VAAGKTESVQRMIVAFGANAALRSAAGALEDPDGQETNRAQHQCDSAKHIPETMDVSLHDRCSQNAATPGSRPPWRRQA
jgi:hypothetical protein